MITAGIPSRTTHSAINLKEFTAEARQKSGVTADWRGRLLSAASGFKMGKVPWHARVTVPTDMQMWMLPEGLQNQGNYFCLARTN